jgi:hypothetical protein
MLKEPTHLLENKILIVLMLSFAPNSDKIFSNLNLPQDMLPDQTKLFK